MEPSYRERQTDRQKEREQSETERERRLGGKTDRRDKKNSIFLRFCEDRLKRFVISWSESKIHHSGSYKVPDTPALCLPHIWCFHLTTGKILMSTENVASMPENKNSYWTRWDV